jgi:hypothetical protein
MDAIAWSAAAAGVPALVVGRWPTEAFTSDAVTAAFHAQLAAGAAVEDAWRKAVADTRGAAAPSAWAGMRLIGGG